MARRSETTREALSIGPSKHLINVGQLKRNCDIGKNKWPLSACFTNGDRGVKMEHGGEPHNSPFHPNRGVVSPTSQSRRDSNTRVLSYSSEVDFHTLKKGMKEKH